MPNGICESMAEGGEREGERGGMGEWVSERMRVVGR